MSGSVAPNPGAIRRTCCPVFVCVWYSHLSYYIYMKIPPKILQLKDFEPPKYV